MEIWAANFFIKTNLISANTIKTTLIQNKRENILPEPWTIGTLILEINLSEIINNATVKRKNKINSKDLVILDAFFLAK